ncbi:MAG: QueT transporter family protein [Tissierellia bacterium]|nr:QueT transporter family protein [Tissierellia bacterium]
MKTNTRKLVRYGFVTAIYVALTWAVPAFNFGPIQFRISEALNLMAYYNPGFVIPISLGCAIGNLYSPFGLLDIFGGMFHTLISLWAMTKVSKDYIAGLFPALFSPIIGLIIYIATGAEVNFWLVTGSVAISEIVICVIISVPLYRFLIRRSEFRSLLLYGEEEII